MGFINYKGVLYVPLCISQPQLIVPHFEISDIRHINLELIKKAGIKGCVLDRDYTITKQGDTNMYSKSSEFINELVDTFPKDKIIIVSNSAGSCDDAYFKDAKNLEESIGINVLRHGTKKPDGKKELQKYFRTDQLENYMMIGDRVLTDVLFGNLCGMLTFLCRPASEESDLKMKCVRNVESAILRFLRKVVDPPGHKCYSPDFVRY